MSSTDELLLGFRLSGDNRSKEHTIRTLWILAQEIFVPSSQKLIATDFPVLVRINNLLGRRENRDEREREGKRECVCVRI